MNKFKIIFTLVCILFATISFSQAWPQYYSQDNAYDRSYDIIETYDNGYIMAGNFQTNDGNEFHQWSWIIKTDINGNILWDKVIEGGDQWVIAAAVEQTSDGGILTCGWVWSELENYDPYVLKLNSCGDKEWCTIFAGSSEITPWADDLVETPSGDIIVLINNYGEINVEDMHLAKLNAQGELLWMEAYCKPEIYNQAALPTGRSLEILSNGDYLVSGEVYWANPWAPGDPWPIRSLFVNVDSIGNEKWVLPFGLTDSIHGQGLNTFEVNPDYFIGIANKWPAETMNSVLIHFDSSGNVKQYIVIDNEQINPDIDAGVPLNLTLTDTLYILGGLYGNIEVAYSSEILIDTNIFNNFIVYDFFQHVGEGEPYTMISCSDDKILSNSTFKEEGNWDISLSKLNLNLEYDTLDPGSYTYDSLCTTPGLPQSGFIYLDNCNLIVDVRSPQEYHAFINTIPLKVYPNPATKGSITFAFENTKHHSNILLKCFNIYGNEVYSEKVYRYQKITEVDISGWQKGMYVAVVYSNGLPVGQCKFVVQ
jgi:hypothetical protein